MSKAPGAYSNRYAKAKRWKVNRRLWRTLCRQIGTERSIVDLGAGGGSYVEAFEERGHHVFGIDGTPDIAEITDERVVYGDLTDPFLWDRVHGVNETWRPDVGLFIEVGEHIPQEHNSVVFDNVCDAATQRLYISWAVPGQPGRGHINCRPPEWVACEMGGRGWTLNIKFTSRARTRAGARWNNRLMVFTPRA